MGYTRYSASDWATHATKTASMPRHEVFTSRSLKDELNPRNIVLRESVDSSANPASTPLILASDVTGSMGSLAERIIKHSLGVIMQEVYDRKPITDPHIMCMATGDVEAGDRAPLQVTQFESEVALMTKQLADIWIEGGGGGNGGESYHLAHWFAANRVVADAQRKRKKRGYIFTIGDEAPLDMLRATDIKRVMGGEGPYRDVNSADLIALLKPDWEVFHLMVRPVGSQPVEKKWRELLGDRAIRIQDAEHMGEVIVSAIQVTEGEDADKVAASWSGNTAVVVADAMRGLTKSGSVGAGPVAVGR